MSELIRLIDETPQGVEVKKNFQLPDGRKMLIQPDQLNVKRKVIFDTLSSVVLFDRSFIDLAKELIDIRELMLNSDITINNAFVQVANKITNLTNGFKVQSIEDEKYFEKVFENKYKKLLTLCSMCINFDNEDLTELSQVDEKVELFSKHFVLHDFFLFALKCIPGAQTLLKNMLKGVQEVKV